MTIETGKLVEIGYVVSDIEEAALFLNSTIGAGPFHVYKDLEMQGVRVRGRPARVPIDIAMGASGDTVIELVRPRDDTPSPFIVPEAMRGEVVFNHWSVFSADFDADYERLLKQGMEEAFFAEISNDDSSQTARLAYFQERGRLGGFYEIMEASPPVLLSSYETIIAAAKDYRNGDDIIVAH